MFLTCSKTYSKEQSSNIYFWSGLVIHFDLLESVYCALVVNNHTNLGNGKCFLQILIVTGFSYSHIQLKIIFVRFKYIFLTEEMFWIELCGIISKNSFYSDRK